LSGVFGIETIDDEEHGTGWQPGTPAMPLDCPIISGL